MSVNYDKLWKRLIDEKMKRTDLLKAANISTSVLAKMGKNEYVSLESIDKICKLLNCKIEDIVEISD